MSRTVDRPAPVLICSLVFPPDGVSTAQLFGELAQDLAGHGHSVVAVTTTPHYGRDVDAEAKQPLARAVGPFVFRSDLGGIPVWHVWHPGGPRTMWKRLVGWTLFHTVGLIVGCATASRGSVVLVPSPLLTAGLVGHLIARLRGGCMIYNVQELYPDLAVRTGRLRSKPLKALAYWLEKFVYERARAVTAITPGMQQRIVQKGLRKEKVHFIPNFVDLGFLEPQPRANAFARKHGLDGKFVVSYAGNMGPAQSLSVVLEAAKNLEQQRNLQFVLIGDGPSHPALRAAAASLDLRNLCFIPHQPYELVPEIYGASDLCVVSLSSALEEHALPSKVLRIMACGRPVLAICDSASGLASLVRESRCGFVVSDDVDVVATAVTRAMENPDLLSEMGEAGRSYVATRFERSVVIGRYSQLINEVSRATVG